MWGSTNVRTSQQAPCASGPVVRLLGWFAAAALVAIAVLPGASVDRAPASGATQSPPKAGNPQVEADPTPTLPPTPTPSANASADTRHQRQRRPVTNGYT